MPSSITGEELEYFAPSPISALDVSNFPVEPFHARQESVAAPIAPMASIVALRGRTMLSIEIIAGTRNLLGLASAWSGRRLDADAVRTVHSSLVAQNGEPSSFRNFVVWVDGLRPRDAALIPCPASMVPDLLEDYFAFLQRDDVSPWIRLAIGHYQLLMIHPFFDGNGRVSRFVAFHNAQRFLPPSQAMALVAALALQRRALRSILDKMRRGDIGGYLEYWAKLVQWSGVAVAEITRLGEDARRQLLSTADATRTSHRFANFMLDEPLFSEDVLQARLNASRKVTQGQLDLSLRNGTIEIYRTDQRQYYRCPIAIDFWRQSMDFIGSSCAVLLDDGDSKRSLTSPSP